MVHRTAICRWCGREEQRRAAASSLGGAGCAREVWGLRCALCRSEGVLWMQQRQGWQRRTLSSRVCDHARHCLRLAHYEEARAHAG